MGQGQALRSRREVPHSAEGGLTAGAIVLAAGAGRRFGGPKALALLDGEPFLAHVVRACRSGGCTPVWAVIRADAPDLERLVVSLGAHPAVNPDPDRGMFSSVQAGLAAGLAAAGDAAEAWVVFPVDHPRVRGTTVHALLEAFPERPAGSWVQPSFEGRPGHPIVIDAAVARRLPVLSPAVTLRDALRSLGLAGHRIPVDDPGVVANLNTPD